ncbi:hypothetical protein MUK42_33720 [Musa troglodytarum]|uniref:Uncharacterized protein n=1 Tax=Musa troglodytarum TaxID=320322 RepID=A0A9E7EI23_9LILI|nr:hypothetical protein MUK42_33720 [Musa troglodytarum]
MIYDVNSPLFRSFLSQKGGSAADKRIQGLWITVLVQQQSTGIMSNIMASVYTGTHAQKRLEDVDVGGIDIAPGDHVGILDVELEVRSTIGRRLRTSGIGPRRACCTKNIGVVEFN